MLIPRCSGCVKNQQTENEYFPLRLTLFLLMVFGSLTWWVWLTGKIINQGSICLLKISAG